MKKEKPLKTLKDLKKNMIKADDIDDMWVSQLELKAEAIKWVKFYRTYVGRKLTEKDFMRFHNVKEEDLK